MAVKAGPGKKVIAEINVIPLVDIVLVVLIIFMVTAPMIMNSSIKVNLPKAASGEKTSSEGLNISLTGDGRVNLNGSFLSLNEVKDRVLAEVKKNAQIEAVISADKASQHGKVIELIDVVKSAGVENFAISIEKKK